MTFYYTHRSEKLPPAVDVDKYRDPRAVNVQIVRDL